MVTGCVEPSGCVPLKIEDKYVIITQNVQSLHVNVSGEDYIYYNPTLVTFSQLEINETYSMRFQPMFNGKPEVEACGGMNP